MDMTERTRLQVPFREDLKRVLVYLGKRDNRTPPNMATHLLETVVIAMGRELSVKYPELALEMEQAGVDLSTGITLHELLAEVTK